MAKAEIGWVRSDAGGGRIEVYVQHVGDRWLFYTRARRYDPWQPLADPPLEDWLELLGAVARRVARRRLRPEEVDRVEKTIRERFPKSGV